MKTFWLKEIVLNKLFLPSGAQVPFESVDGTYGILETEDGYIASELAKAVRNHVGGVMSLTEGDTPSGKKKLLSSGSPALLPRDRESLGPIPTSELQQLRSKGLAAVVSGVDASGNVQPSLNPLASGPNRAQQQATSQAVPTIEVPAEFKVPARVGKASAARRPSGATNPANPV